MARILSLADGTMTLLPRGVPASAASEVTLASFFSGLTMKRRPGRGVVGLAEYVVGDRSYVPPVNPATSAPVNYDVNGHTFQVMQLSEDYLTTLGDSLERLASMTLARKLKSPAPIDAVEAAQMVGLAGVPNTRGGQMLTAQILAASAEELGKGGIIGQITSTISHVAQQVVKPIAKIAQAAAPLLSKVPVVGPALGAAVQVTANAAAAVAGGSLKSLTSGGIMGLTQKVAGWAGAGAGTAVGLVGDVAQGIVEAPQTIAQDLTAAGQWAGGAAQSMLGSVSSYLGGDNGASGFFNSLVQGGKSLVASFDSSVISSIESVNPALSGQLTSIFHGLGAEYTNFQAAFDQWSAAMKSAPTGTAAVGKLGDQLYSIVKGLDGNMSVTKTAVSNAPAGATSLPQGQLVPASQLSGFGVSQPAAGAGYGPGFSGPASGLPTNPAGISLPGGPINPSNDPTSLRILGQAANNANAGKSPLSLLSSGYSTPMIALAGAAILYFTLGRNNGGGELMYAPRRRRASRRRR